MNLEPTRHGESTPGPENADGGQLVREKKSGRLGLGGAEGLGPGMSNLHKRAGCVDYDLPARSA